MNRKGYKKLRQSLLSQRFFMHNSGSSFMIFLRRPALHIAVLVILSLFYSACAERNVFLIKKKYDVVYEKKEEVPVTYRAKQYEVNSEDITAIESTAGSRSYNPAGLERYIYLSPDSSGYYGPGYNPEGAVK